ncbi:phage tail tape measure protein [Clostridium cadaveris]|uniref:phage tail tape measure protein n=1 Tax=Clostridium cadaveris TaxID=1529 RepID=UPI0015B5416C|nr:phage tail tape measure protein [Clostridium cadaveris]NWK12887.1 phage tail tape measure protein [Clostridium cadaveris]
MTLEELEVVISANAKQFNTQVAQVQNKVDSMASRVNNKVDSMSGTFAKLGKILASVFAITAIGRFTKSCLDLGSNLTEVQNVVDVTFGSMSDKVNEFAKNAWQTVGLSETMAKQYMGNFGAMSKSMGFTVGEAEKMAEILTNLSGDVASFYNIEQSEAYTKLKSVFTGETETLKELGVVMTQENLNQYALANGYGKTTEKMNQQEKVALRLAYVTQTLSAANGDFARTSNTWANQVRLLSLQYQSLKASIGQGLIAVLTPVINVINIIMAKLVQMANTFNSVLSAIGFSFGGDSGGENTAFAGATSGIDDATGAMNNLGGATDKAGKKAGKAKKQLEALMGIDEINKLKSADNSGGGGAGAGGPGTISSPAIDTSKTENSLTELNNKVKKLLEELLAPLKKAWDNYGDWFLSKWDYFKKAFGYSCDELKKFLISVWNHGGKEFVQHMAEIGIVIGGVALQIGGDILVALGNLWRHLNPDNNPYTRKFIDAMNKLAIAVRDFIISAGNWFSQFMNLGGQAFINCIGDIVVIVGTTLAKVLTDIINVVRAFMNSWAGHIIIQACALTLNIVAGAIKAVAIVIEKCHKVLTIFIALWSAWRFSRIISGIGDTTTKLGALTYRLYGLRVNIADNIIQFKKWVIEVGKNSVGALVNFGNSIRYILWYLKELSIEMGIKAIGALKKFLVSIGANTASLLGLTVAEGTATAGATVLNIALGALGIGVIIAAVSGLVIAVKKIGDKFGWWANISNALGKVLGLIGDKVGWLWDKIKSFFGWDTEPEVKENIESIGTTAEATAKTTDEKFGTATSNVNRYLDSIHFNATRLSQEVDEATKSATEKFGMLSQSATEYLDAIKNHNTEKLAEMGSNQSVYNEEIKAMYADLTEAEKNEFLKQYGIIQGINDDILNYEGLKYDDRVARHAAYLQTIQNDESLSYQQKKEKMDQANADFQASIDSEVAKYQESITSKQAALDELLSTHGNTTAQGRMYEQQLRDEIDADRAHIEDITKTSYDNQVTTVEGATDAMAQANADSATAQEDAYKNIATTAEESMAIVNESLNTARENISAFAADSATISESMKASFDGVGDSITAEFSSANSGITGIMLNMISMVNNAVNVIRSSVRQAFTYIANTIKSSMNQASNTIKSAFNNISNVVNISLYQVVNTTSNTLNIMKNGFDMIGYSADYSFRNIYDNISSRMSDIYSRVSGSLGDIRSLFDNFSATLKVKIPHFYMTGNFNLETKEVPKVGVNYFAKGGIVDRATLGIIGEAGKEAVMPLENNTGWITDLADKVASRMPQGGSNDNSNGDLVLMIDGSVIGKVALNQLRKMQRQGGITLIPT